MLTIAAMIRHQLKASGLILALLALLAGLALLTTLTTPTPQLHGEWAGADLWRSTATSALINLGHLATVILGMLWSLAVFDLLASSYLHPSAPRNQPGSKLSAQRDERHRMRSFKWLSIKWLIMALGGGLWYSYGETADTLPLVIGLSFGLIIFGWSLHASTRMKNQAAEDSPTSKHRRSHKRLI